MYGRLRRVAVLTPRELEVIGLVARGLTNREIARVLGISPGTVRAHLEHAFTKLGVGTRTAAVAMAG
ncbi:MAG: helix-turn-helix transcriptional regulator [Actinomycetota bacterium]